MGPKKFCLHPKSTFGLVTGKILRRYETGIQSGPKGLLRLSIKLPFPQHGQPVAVTG